MKNKKCPIESFKTMGTEGHWWTSWLAERLGSPYSSYYHAALETQVMPVELTDGEFNPEWDSAWDRHGNRYLAQPRPVRTVVTDRDGAPIKSNDGPVDYPPELILTAGTSWWNWRDRLTEACYFDFDYGHGGKALDEVGIARVDEWAKTLPYVSNITSRSGRGRHWFIRPSSPLPAPTRRDHIFNCHRIRAKVTADLGFEIGDYVCSFGGIQYIWSKKSGRLHSTEDSNRDNP